MTGSDVALDAPHLNPPATHNIRPPIPKVLFPEYEKDTVALKGSARWPHFSQRAKRASDDGETCTGLANIAVR